MAGGDSLRKGRQAKGVWYQGRWMLKVAPTAAGDGVSCVKKHQEKHHQMGLDYPKLMDEASPSNAFSK